MHLDNIKAILLGSGFERYFLIREFPESGTVFCMFNCHAHDISFSINVAERPFPVSTGLISDHLPRQLPFIVLPLMKNQRTVDENSLDPIRVQVWTIEGCVVNDFIRVENDKVSHGVFTDHAPVLQAILSSRKGGAFTNRFLQGKSFPAPHMSAHNPRKGAVNGGGRGFAIDADRIGHHGTIGENVSPAFMEWGEKALNRNAWPLPPSFSPSPNRPNIDSFFSCRRSDFEMTFFDELRNLLIDIRERQHRNNFFRINDKKRIMTVHHEQMETFSPGVVRAAICP
jgi:hypothetical protein